MSELINNSDFRKEELKKLILKLHEGHSPELIRKELMETLSAIPYGEVVEVEQELIEQGLPVEEVLKLCDVHGEVLDGHIDLSASQQIPEGHPVDVFYRENEELQKLVDKCFDMLKALPKVPKEVFGNYLLQVQGFFNDLMDVDKHYQRKEYLVFPYLEKSGITGPPKVMWGKHDEIREQLRGCIEVLRTPNLEKEDMEPTIAILFYPALRGIRDMIKKEEEILFPMAMDVLTTEDWWNIHKQTLEIGFTLYDPQTDWKPEGYYDEERDSGPGMGDGSIQLPSGSFTANEIMAILNTLPVDMTFVDKNDKVKYFSQGEHRFFTRSRSIINRDVRLCHPPGSVHIVEKILEDFKSGKESKASFWIQLRGKFVLIEYYALRGEKNEYLGTLEVSQDLTELRKLEGEQRILSYGS
ncbi:MAG: DUF438 domain-containing protein [Bacteroidales bacterium]|nr:DUF438 domain-containing protein [Bacteroidales bacterium]